MDNNVIWPGKLVGVNNAAVVNYGIEIPTHKDKWRVTVRSDDPADLEAVRAQVRLAGWEGRTLTECYAPASWQLSPGLDFGMVHVQQPPDDAGRGIMIHSQPNTERLTTALRVADPTFRPENVPDLRDSGSSVNEVLLLVAVCVGYVGGLLTRRIKK